MGETLETKVTSEEMFDNDKFVLDEEDKHRIEKNIDTLKQNNIPAFEYMRTVPINSTTVIKSREEILNKAICDYTLATCALYALSGSLFLLSPLLEKLNKKYDIRQLLSLEEKRIVVDIVNNCILAGGLEELCAKYESVYVCLWALGFLNRPSSSTKNNIKDINKVMFKVHDYDDIRTRSKLRSKDEILEFADLVTRYEWALKEGKPNNAKLDNLDADIVEIQNETLNFITSYSLDNLTKDRLKVTCEKGDLRFEFNIPSFLNFEKVGENSKELVAFKSGDQESKLVIQDLGHINKYEYDLMSSKNIRMFQDNKFEIIGTYYFDLSYMDERVKHIVIERNNLALNIYYIYISYHLLRLDSLINKNTNYKEYSDNINSRNTNIDLDIIFSMKELN